MTNINDYNRAELKKICNIHNKNLKLELELSELDKSTKNKIKEMRFIDLKIITKKEDIIKKMFELKDFFEDIVFNIPLELSTPLQPDLE
tara:strand:- start:1233 stop:1499 length:267 start_codon:yes stop_codon:yes gene_type:complete